MKLKSYRCRGCSDVYDPELGDPIDTGVLPGTPWEKVPDGWCCPNCGAGKAEFEPVED